MIKTKVLTAFTLATLSVNSGAFEFDKEVPANLRQEIMQDLNFMKSLQGSDSTALHKQFFAEKIDGEAYFKFFSDRVTHIGLDDCGDGKAVACVIPWAGSSRIWLTPNYTRFSHPQIAKLMVVYHEARHTEDAQGNWMHARCPRPFLDENGKEIRSIWTGSSLAGEAACDSQVGGSYGSSTILLKNIAKYCSNCSEKVKQDAELYANDQLKRLVGRAKQDATSDLK